MTTYSEAMRAAEQHFQANWKRTPTYGGNEPAKEPSPPAPFAKMRAKGQRGRYAGAAGEPGAWTVQRSAGLEIILFIPRGAGERLALELATHVEELFAMRFLAAADGGTVDCGAPMIGDPYPADDAEQWLAVSVTIPFTYHGTLGGEQ